MIHGNDSKEPSKLRQCERCGKRMLQAEARPAAPLVFAAVSAWAHQYDTARRVGRTESLSHGGIRRLAVDKAHVATAVNC